MTRRIFIMAVLTLTLVAARTQAQPQTFEHDQLAIETAGGAEHFAVELAVTSEQRAQGLMFRQRLAADAGMLFLYPASRPISMWMKNTVIPLDMLFIGDDGRILQIAERAIPESTATISSMEPARSVLDLNGGTAARLKIPVGDRVWYRTFGTAE